MYQHALIEPSSLPILLRLEFRRGPFSVHFVIYINDLSDRLNSIPELFVDDTSLFSNVQDFNESAAKYLNFDVSINSQWACLQKMLFNKDPKNPAHEVIFSRKKVKKPILKPFPKVLKLPVQISSLITSLLLKDMLRIN